MKFHCLELMEKLKSLLESVLGVANAKNAFYVEFIMVYQRAIVRIFLQLLATTGLTVR